MPLDTVGKDDVFVGHVRKDLSDENGLTFWLSGDQIHKGAVLNAVQIGEYLIANDLKFTRQESNDGVVDSRNNTIVVI